MRIAGNATLHAPVETVYAALRDPRVLVRTIPGCERLEQVGEDAYQMTVTAGVASVRGTYAGDVRLTDPRAPHGVVLRASGSGAPGTVSADVTVELSPGDNGTTELSYDADAVVGGMIGGSSATCWRCILNSISASRSCSRWVRYSGDSFSNLVRRITS